MSENGGPFGFGFWPRVPEPPPVDEQLEDAVAGLRQALHRAQDARAVLDTVRVDVEGTAMGKPRARRARERVMEAQEVLAALEEEVEASKGFASRLKGFLNVMGL